MKIAGLGYQARDIRILDNVSVEFPPGTTTALIGPNGAGKTTLLRCLAGDLPFDSGEVEIEGRGQDLRSDEWRRMVGFVPDSDMLFDELTVHEQLTLAAELFGIDSAERTLRVESLLTLTGLSDRIDAPARELSAGMRKRLALGLALIHAPQILLFDEPLSTLDYASSETFFALLEFLRSVRRTVVITGHSLSALARTADRYAEMDGGRIVNCFESGPAPQRADAILPRLRTAAGSSVPVFPAAVVLPWMTA
ncbi:ABC transporter ATP-binding protein [Salinispira pacifica]